MPRAEAADVRRVEYIYVLHLAGGYFYVGKSCDVNRRVEEHVRPGGAAWVARRAIERVTIWGEVRSPFDEDNVTKAYMEEHGIDRVRGGVYVEVELEAATVALLRKEEWGRGGKCTRCGWGTHFFVDCYAKTTINGLRLAAREDALRVGATASVAPVPQGDEGCASPRSGRRVGQPETPATCERSSRPPISSRTLAAASEEEQEQEEEEEEVLPPAARDAGAVASAMRRALWGTQECGVDEAADACAESPRLASAGGEQPTAAAATSRQLSLRQSPVKLAADAHKAAGDRLCADSRGSCFRCGRSGHYASRCDTRTMVDGGSLSSGADNDDDDGPYRRRARQRVR